MDSEPESAECFRRAGRCPPGHLRYGFARLPPCHFSPDVGRLAIALLYTTYNHLPSEQAHQWCRHPAGEDYPRLEHETASHFLWRQG